MTKWPMIPLKDLATPRGLVGGPFGSSLGQKDYVSKGVPVIRGQNLSHRFVDFDDVVFVSEEKLAKELSRNTAEPGDLVFTQRGTLGQIAQMPPEAPTSVISQSQMRLRIDETRANPTYVYYACSSKLFMASIENHAIVAGVPHINLGILGNLEIPLPILSEQNDIASLLDTVDSLIAKDLKLLDDTKKLSRIQLKRFVRTDSQSVPLGDLAHVNPMRVGRPDEKPVTYLAIADVKDGLVNWPAPSAWQDAPAAARLLAQAGDVIWSRVRPNRRSHALIPAWTQDVVVSTGLVVLRPKTVSSAYLMAICDSPEFSDRLVSIAGGTAYPTVDAADFSKVEVPLISDDDLREFDSVFTPLWDAVGALELEVSDLQLARQELLGLLLSGVVGFEEVRS